MKSLQVNTILSLLNRETQVELYKELSNVLLKNNNFKFYNIYTILMNESYPTGGDWCHNDTLVLATGNYKEAKDKYDTLCEEIEKYGDLYMELEKTVMLIKGDDVLDSIYYDNNNNAPKVTKKSCDKNNEHENYEIKFPIYYIMKRGSEYDSLHLIDVYENFENAKQDFYILQLGVEEPEGGDINIMLFSLSDDNKRKLVLDFTYSWDEEFPDNEIME